MDLMQQAWRGNSGAQATMFLLCFYALFLMIRVYGCFRRGRQPLLRGPEWFFNVHVRPGFYEGEGKKLLHRYWLRMILVAAADIPLAIPSLVFNRSGLLAFVMLAEAVAMHLNHSYSVAAAERKAQRFAAPEDAQPAGSVMLSLKPRRLRDYANAKFEWTLGIVTVFAIALLVRDYLDAPAAHSLRYIFSVPIMMLYVQAGYLLVKQIIVGWRSPVPQTQTAEHIEAREQTRKFYLKVCDWSRTAAVATLAFWPVEIYVSSATADRLMELWFVSWIALSVVATVWVEWKRKQLVKVQLRARPVNLPDFLRQDEIAKWPVCYEPSAPMLMLKGARGYSLNLANSMAIAGAVYIAGLITLLAVLPQR